MVQKKKVQWWCAVCSAEIEKSSTHEFELAGQHIDPVQLDSSLTYIPGKSQVRFEFGLEFQREVGLEFDMLDFA